MVWPGPCLDCKSSATGYSRATSCCNQGAWRKDHLGLNRLQGQRSMVVGCYGNSRGIGDNLEVRRAAMGIDWMGLAGTDPRRPPRHTRSTLGGN